MLITSYNRKLADGSLEADAATGLPVVYSMGGAADERVPDDAVNVVTNDVTPAMSVDQRQTAAVAIEDAWAKFQGDA